MDIIHSNMTEEYTGKESKESVFSEAPSKYTRIYGTQNPLKLCIALFDENSLEEKLKKRIRKRNVRVEKTEKTEKTEQEIKKEMEKIEKEMEIANLLYFLLNNTRWTGRGNFDPEEYRGASSEQKCVLVQVNSLWYEYYSSTLIENLTARGVMSNVVKYMYTQALDDPWFPLDTKKDYNGIKLTPSICCEIITKEFAYMDSLAKGDWWSFCHTENEVFYVNKQRQIFAKGLYYHVGTLFQHGHKYMINWHENFNRGRISDIVHIFKFDRVLDECILTLDEYYLFISTMAVAMGATLYTRIPPHKFECLPMGFAKLIVPIKHEDVNELTRNLLSTTSDNTIASVLGASDLRVPCKTCNQKKPLKRCSRCKRVSYCSIECQHADWSNHKEFCKDNVLSVKKKLPVITVTVS